MSISVNTEQPSKGPPPIARMSNRQLATELATFGNQSDMALLKPQDFLTFNGRQVPRQDLLDEVQYVRTNGRSLWVKEVLERKSRT